MIRVSLSEAEKSIDSIWIWYQRASGGLRSRLLDEQQKAVALVVSPVFFGMTSQDLEEFFLELDYLAMLDLLSATEAALRVDFWNRVHDKEKDELSRRFRDLVKQFDEKIAFEEHILDTRVACQPEVKSQTGDFKGVH
jgi:hypothetical protein